MLQASSTRRSSCCYTSLVTQHAMEVAVPANSLAHPLPAARSVPANELAAQMMTDHQRGASLPVLGPIYSDGERVQQWVHQHASCGAGSCLGPSASIEPTPHPSVSSSACASPRAAGTSARGDTAAHGASEGPHVAAHAHLDAPELCSQLSADSSGKCPTLPPAPPAPPPDSRSQSATVPGLDAMLTESGYAAFEREHSSFSEQPQPAQRQSASGAEVLCTRRHTQHGQHAQRHSGGRHGPHRRWQSMTMPPHLHAASGGEHGGVPGRPAAPMLPAVQHHGGGRHRGRGAMHSSSQPARVHLPHARPMQRPRASMDAQSACEAFAAVPPLAAPHLQRQQQQPPAASQHMQGGQGHWRQQAASLHFPPQGSCNLQGPVQFVPPAFAPCGGPPTLHQGTHALGRGHSATAPHNSSVMPAAPLQATVPHGPALPPGMPTRPPAPVHPALPVPVQLHSAKHGAQGTDTRPSPHHAAPVQQAALPPRHAPPYAGDTRLQTVQQQQQHAQAQAHQQRRLRGFSASGGHADPPAQHPAGPQRLQQLQQTPRQKARQRNTNAGAPQASAVSQPSTAKGTASAHAALCGSPARAASRVATSSHAAPAGADASPPASMVPWESDLTRFLTEVERLFVPLRAQCAIGAGEQPGGVDATPYALAASDAASTLSPAAHTASMMHGCTSAMTSIDEACPYGSPAVDPLEPGTSSHIGDAAAATDRHALHLLPPPPPPSLPPPCLGDLWAAFRDCSALCLEVPTVNGVAGPSLAYFMPSLSAVQITAVNDAAAIAHVSRNSRDQSFEGFASETDDEQRSVFSCPPTPPMPVLSNTSAIDTACVRSETWSTHAGDSAMTSPPRTRAQSVDPGELPVATRDPDAATGGKAQQRLVANWAASGKPWDRPPLFQQAEALCAAEPSPAVPLPPALWHMPLHALHPESWFAVLWLPLYRIPDDDLKARFITYHRIVAGGAKGATAAGAANTDASPACVQLSGLLVNTGDSACNWTDWSSCDAFGARMQRASKVRQELQDLRDAADAHSRAAVYAHSRDGTWVPAPFEHSDHRFVSSSMQ